VRFPDPSPQTIFTVRHGNEMHMIRHKAVRPDFHSALSTPFSHEIDVGVVVSVFEEGCHTPVPALGNMVRNAGCYNTSDTSHVPKLVE
jgi:hypothetical protein